MHDSFRNSNPFNGSSNTTVIVISVIQSLHMWFWFLNFFKEMKLIVHNSFLNKSFL